MRYLDRSKMRITKRIAKKRTRKRKTTTNSLRKRRKKEDRPRKPKMTNLILRHLVRSRATTHRLRLRLRIDSNMKLKLLRPSLTTFGDSPSKRT